MAVFLYLQHFWRHFTPPANMLGYSFQWTQIFMFRAEALVHQHHRNFILLRPRLRNQTRNPLRVTGDHAVLLQDLMTQTTRGNSSVFLYFFKFTEKLLKREAAASEKAKKRFVGLNITAAPIQISFQIHTFYSSSFSLASRYKLPAYIPD